MVSVDHLFQSYVENVHTITLGFALGTLALLVMYLMNSLKDDGYATEAAASGNLENIEETLKKLLEGARFSGVAMNTPTEGVAETPRADAAGPAAPGERPVVNVIDNDEVNRLKVQLGERDHKLAELESAFAKVLKQAAEKGSEDDLKSLQMQVKDLEAKLAEYEIIEDDIANLTTYKEENARLKDEIARVKGGGAPVAVSEPARPVDDNLMAEFQAAVDAQKTEATPISVGPAVGTGPASSQSTPPTAVDDALMKEFANAVKPAVEPVAAASPEVAPAPVASAPEASTSAPGAGTPAQDPMFKADVAKETGELPEALNTAFDPDTMLSEVQAIDVNAPVVTDGQDEGEKLIAEFENFIDKN